MLATSSDIGLHFQLLKVKSFRHSVLDGHACNFFRYRTPIQFPRFNTLQKVSSLMIETNAEFINVFTVPKNMRLALWDSMFRDFLHLVSKRIFRAGRFPDFIVRLVDTI